jgi:nucleotide-binding universal stress UspA family protein
MSPFDDILAATDLREMPDSAVDSARVLAAALGARLHVFHCVKRSRSRSVDRGRLERARASISARAEPADTIDVRIGTPYRAIASRAAAVDAGLIVLGPHRQGTRTGILGTTSDRVLRTTRRPCLLSNEPSERTPARIAVAVDESEHARRAAAVAASLLGRIVRRDPGVHASLHFVNISAFAEPGANPAEELVDFGELAAAVQRDGAAWQGEIGHSVYSAPFADEGILTFCDRYAPDLLVMGTHGDGTFVRALLGSVALDVARQLRRPLLIVPKP